MSGRGISVTFRTLRRPLTVSTEPACGKYFGSREYLRRSSTLSPFFTTILPVLCKIPAQALLSTRVFASVVLCPPLYSY